MIKSVHHINFIFAGQISLALQLAFVAGVNTAIKIKCWLE